MADGRNLSVEEVLAACRASDGGATADVPPAAEPKGESTLAADSNVGDSELQNASGEPAAPTASDKKPSEMSVADILAAARDENSVKTEKPKKAVASKAKPAVSKASPKAPSKSSAKVPKDTMSILAAARKSQKAGPMSKSEAAAQVKDHAPAAKGKRKIAVPPIPEKPAYAIERAVSSEPVTADRRGFISTAFATFVGSFLAVGFTSLGLTHLLWLLGFARFMFPNIRIEPPSSFRVGFPDEYAPGQVEAKFKAQFGVWIVRYEYEGESQIYALKSVCTHLGCTPNWLEGEQKFKCPCHGSGFYKDGINFEGPAPRPLERYAISLAADGQLVVDKSKLFNEEKGQWKDPISFVPV